MSRLLAEALQDSAAQVPGRLALIDGPRRVTYAQLWRDARIFGAFLRSNGLCPADRVALILPNSIEFVTAFYGTLLAGGVAVPMNVAARRGELAAWLGHSEATWAIYETVNGEATAAIHSIDRTIRRVTVGHNLSDENCSSFSELLTQEYDLEPELSPSDHLACILYTSGTTGRPKGVMLSGGNLASNAQSIVGYLGLTGADIGLGMLPFSYSYGSSVLHTHIAVSATIVIARNFAYPHAVVELMSRERVTGMAGVPSTYSLLLSRVRLENYDLSSLRYLTQAGGPISDTLVRRLRESLPGRQIYLMYGQTEATARLTYLPPVLLSQKSGSVGIPIPGVSIEIRNEHGMPVPRGLVGEVWASGPNIMLGYWRDEEATKAVLQNGWLKTGDMGRIDSDGFLYLHGRRSDIIKVGEHSVLPQEIEEVIAKLPGVGDVAAVGVNDEILGQAIVAFVVPTGDKHLDARMIRRQCRHNLALYKVPKRVEFLKALPRTESGKVLRRVLSGIGPDMTRSDVATASNLKGGVSGEKP